MYVCICNALTERDVAVAVTDGGARRPADLFAACRCRAQCGTCVRRILDLLRTDELADPMSTGAALTPAA